MWRIAFARLTRSLSSLSAHNACLSPQRNVSDLVAALKHFSRTKDLKGGKKLHREAIETGHHLDKYVSTALITMYSRCGSISDAKEVFDSMPHRDIVSWNSLIMGYVENGGSHKAIDLFTRVDCKPESGTYVAVLKACASLGSVSRSERQFGLEKGLEIHAQLRKLGLGFNVVLESTLLNMYCKCGSMQNARHVFDNMLERSVVTCTSLILGYVENGEALVAIDLFTSMDCEPDSVAFVAVVKACSNLASERKMEREFCLIKGMEFHRRARELGFDSDTFLASTLVDMYSKCGRMVAARRVFDRMIKTNVVAWNSLLNGYVENGESPVATEMFMKMDCQPDSLTYVAALKACIGLGAGRHCQREFCMEKGVALHRQAKEYGFDLDIFVANNLVDMYSKFGSMNHARNVFDRVSHRNTVLWNCLILGYIENGKSAQAMELFTSMDIVPDSLTYIAAIKACGCLSALPVGKKIHSQVCRLGLEKDEMVMTSLVDFYGKCCKVEAAELVFGSMNSRNIVSWNALLAGYSMFGDCARVFELTRLIQELGLEMDDVTFICVLTACSHGGLVEKGTECFKAMARHGIQPRLEHYTCMVDMLGRANRLQEALAVVKEMPVQVDSVAWKSLLAACRKWSNVEVGKHAFDGLVLAENANAAAYVLLGNIYRTA